MKHRKFAILAVTLAAAVNASVAHAQSAMDATTAPAYIMDATTAPAYISGGVGAPDVERLKSQERDYGLKLVFTLNEGNYVAGVAISLRDAKGNSVIDAVSDGPIFMAKLAPGGYTIAATYEGRTLTRKIGVPARGLRTEYLRWPANPATDFAMARSTPQ